MGAEVRADAPRVERGVELQDLAKERRMIESGAVGVEVMKQRSGNPNGIRNGHVHILTNVHNLFNGDC